MDRMSAVNSNLGGGACTDRISAWGRRITKLNDNELKMAVFVFVEVCTCSQIYFLYEVDF